MSENVDPSLERWLLQQMPRVVKKVKLRQLNEQPLHLSKSKISVFSPRIPLSVAQDEDMTVPRICCSVDITRCIHGVRHLFSTIEIPTRLFLHGFHERAVVQPSVDLTCEPNRAGEVWIVPHRMSNWDIKPTMLGEMRLSSLGESGSKFTYQMCFGQDVRWNSYQLLKAGVFYEAFVTVNWEKETLQCSDAKEVGRSAFDTALNEYSVTP